MAKTILITGATDGIGLEAAKTLHAQGHHILLHGRSASKLKAAQKALSELARTGRVDSYLADLSSMVEVEKLGETIARQHSCLDVVINNAGVFRTAETFTDEGVDFRFAVNTYAPYLLTKRLLPTLTPGSRIINVASAAQAPVDLDALAGEIADQFNAYAQSKLALIMWTRVMAQSVRNEDLIFVAVNPGSLLATKMVKEGFGLAGKDIHIGSDILDRAALSDEFSKANGLYFDNDHGQFAAPDPDALDEIKCERVVAVMESVLADKLA